MVKVDPVDQLVGQQGANYRKRPPVRPSGGLRGAGRSGRDVWPIVGRGAGGIGRRWSVAGNVDTTTTGECRDECQRAKDVFQPDSHAVKCAKLVHALAFRLFDRQIASREGES